MQLVTKALVLAAATAPHGLSGLTVSDDHARIVPALAAGWRPVDACTDDRAWEFSACHLNDR